MVALINFKETLIGIYRKREDILRPLLKGFVSAAVLCLLQTMFQFLDTRLIITFLVISFAQAFLPMALLYFSGSALIAFNLWQISPDMCLGYVLLFLIGLLTYVRIDHRTACITMLVPVLFFLRLEYLIPVALGITIGFSGIFPAVFGTLIYYMIHYTGDASNLLINSTESDMGTGLARVVNLMIIDRKMLLLLVTFVIVIFITSLLFRMFYELAWLFSVTFGNAAMVFLMLCGRYIFELDFAIWRLFLEAILSIVLCTIIQFFRGIGDISRIERTSFEDDDYIYYVKAVPKIRVAQKNRNVTNISTEMLEQEAELAGLSAESDVPPEEETPVESGEMRRKRRAERKRIFGRRKKQDLSKKEKEAGAADGAGAGVPDARAEAAAESSGSRETDQLNETEPVADEMIEVEPAADETAAGEMMEAGPAAEETATDGMIEAESAADEPAADETVAGGMIEAGPAAEETTAGGIIEAEPAAEEPATAGMIEAESAVDEPAADETVAGGMIEAEPVAEETTAGGIIEAEPVAEETTAGGMIEAGPVAAEPAEDAADEKGNRLPKKTFADAVMVGMDKEESKTMQKLDMEDILKENIAAARELSASDRQRRRKE